jgi:hypothetical protein
VPAIFASGNVPSLALMSDTKVIQFLQTPCQPLKNPLSSDHQPVDDSNSKMAFSSLKGKK